ncbi:MAG: hypothetical protein HYV28_15270, partial [Ignavibacteriales bacterium]|nr:hypothetical protein [Ignavibacteriales bacterium]
FRGKFNTALFGTAIRKKILNDSLNIISLGGTVSYGSFTQSIDASILYPNFPDNNRTAYQSYGGQLLCFEPHFEFEHKLYSIIWGRLHVGYRIGKTLKKQNDDDMIPEQFRVQEEATPKVNPDGFVISLGFVLKRPGILLIFLCLLE